MHDPRVGRFFAIDPLFKDYPYYTPYQFSGNRVIDAIELEGLETFFVHGTVLQMFGGRSSTFMFEQTDYIVKKLPPVLGNKTANFNFEWDGGNSDEARQKGAQLLVEHIMKNRKPGEPISIVGHSHGGNLAIEAANILVRDHKIQANEITIVALNTPMQDEITSKYGDFNIIAISAKDDLIQRYASESDWSKPNTVENCDISIYYEDQINGIDVDHVGPNEKNVKTWLPELTKILDSNKKRYLDFINYTNKYYTENKSRLGGYKNQKEYLDSQLDYFNYEDSPIHIDPDRNKNKN